MKKLRIPLILASLTLASNAVVVYNDAVDGNASSDGATPTVLGFSLGSNEVLGTVSAAPSIGNIRNFYTFTIEAGQELGSITLDTLNVTTLNVTTNTLDPSNDPGFYALVSGSPAATPGTGFANLGGELFDPSDVGSNLLTQISDGGNSGGSGFTSIGAGDYTFVIQQTGTEISTFQLNFEVVNAIPEPSSSMLLGLTAFGLIARRRRS